jgi:hypothetical protein
MKEAAEKDVIIVSQKQFLNMIATGELPVD